MLISISSVLFYRKIAIEKDKTIVLTNRNTQTDQKALGPLFGIYSALRLISEWRAHRGTAIQ